MKVTNYSQEGENIKEGHKAGMKRKRKHEKEKIGRNREFHTLPGTDLSPTRPEEAPRRSRK